jgi:hypothetical protein
MEHIILVVVAVAVGFMQALILMMLKGMQTRQVTGDSKVDALKDQISDKVGMVEHKRIEFVLADFGNRILTLELAVKVIEKDKE